MSLGSLIQIAYRTLPDQVSGPEWIYRGRFDVLGTMPADTTRDQAQLMLQTLLAERFQLKVHREERITEVFALEVAKSGPKMETTEWDDGPGRSINLGPSVTARRSNMEALAGILSRWMDRKVVDKTGLTSLYNFTLRWQAEGPAGTISAGSEVFGALEAQLGLKLSPRKLPIEFVVVDHAEKLPSEN